MTPEPHPLGFIQVRDAEGSYIMQNGCPAFFWTPAHAQKYIGHCASEGRTTHRDPDTRTAWQRISDAVMGEALVERFDNAGEKT